MLIFNRCCDNGGEFKGLVTPLCIRRNIRVVNGRAYHPQTQGGIEQANKVCKARLRAAQGDAPGAVNKCDWKRYLSVIQRIVNETGPEGLPDGITPYYAWFGRPVPVFPEYDQRRRAARAKALGEEPIEVTALNASDSDQEDDNIELELPGQEMFLLSEIGKKVAAYNLIVAERMRRKKGGKIGILFSDQEICTLQIPDKYKIGVENPRVFVRILSKTNSVFAPFLI